MTGKDPVERLFGGIITRFHIVKHFYLDLVAFRDDRGVFRDVFSDDIIVFSDDNRIITLLNKNSV
jgi:hypothetical protein